MCLVSSISGMGLKKMWSSDALQIVYCAVRAWQGRSGPVTEGRCVVIAG